jgi:hypothetical protein
MSTITRHSEVTGRSTEAVVQNFEERKTLNVILNKSIKMSMVWNGTCYEGRTAGMDFISNGPKVSKTQTTSRG